MMRLTDSLFCQLEEVCAMRAANARISIALIGDGLEYIFLVRELTVTIRTPETLDRYLTATAGCTFIFLLQSCADLVHLSIIFVVTTE